jgi:hypothetical protein
MVYFNLLGKSFGFSYVTGNIVASAASPFSNAYSDVAAVIGA